ncbi:FAD-dependent monooxygenase [Haloechinothrix sp. YIM 98757]|uniref:FAD-dependent monooxygenase n=1 Tax=Haloechinothrix aidingensis TaxID=2752311 RepID=A0A838ABN1_9PSEU|nr:FAD-dependent monooxygenase [Haloechinothrix aidingensis]MBA0126636.1 FAD-dependent monooxygenase [Haloechinothrix aidingensis]
MVSTNATAGRVAVIGNGPVGQTAALLLARWGIPVTLLDARPERDLVGSKAICQQRDVLDIWDAVGVGRRVAEEGLTWTTARTFYRDHELFAYTLDDPGQSCFPPFVNISQSRTEELLDERIAGQELIETRWAHEVVGIEQDGTGVRLRCATPAGTVELPADYALACAGATGREVRRALGVTFSGHSFEDRFLICDIRASLPGWSHERRFYFDPEWNPGRQVLIHPCPGSTFRIDWQVPSDYDLEAEEAGGALDERIRAIIGERPYEIVWNSVYRFHSRVVDRMRAGRVLLAGDCAHLFAPFGARGLNSGVADVENAAWKLALVLRGWAGEELLESYHAERHAAALENLDVTTATMDFLVPHTEQQQRTRLDVLERAVHDRTAHAEVNSGRLAEPYWYVDSPLTTPDRRRPFAGRPPRGSTPPAGPGILVPDVPVSAPEAGASRLRELARDGFLLLAGQGTDPAMARDAAAGATAGPVRVLELPTIDPDGTVRRALGARADEVWVIRPDAHTAAVLTEPRHADVAAALGRAAGAGDGVAARGHDTRERA